MIIPETPITDLDWAAVPSPCFVVDRRLLERNARLLARVRQEAGVKVLLALKGYAMWSTFDLLIPHLDGCCASGSWEARLARERFGKEVSSYAPAFTEEDVAECLALSDHLTFNSPAQVERFRHQWSRRPGVSIGLRVNPEWSAAPADMYNPCAPGSRLGSRRALVGDRLPAGVEGLHAHVLCQQGAVELEGLVAAVEASFGDLFPGLRWINFGGGHHLTRPDYDVDRAIAVLRAFRARHPHLTVYLEPGEAVGLNTGVLVSTVLDVIENGLPIAILDVSTTAHMPDVLEMPYRPTVHGGGDPGATPHTYRLAGPTCLAGDVAGDWSFAAPLETGQRLVFADMAHYTMVKTTTFNGVKHPSLATWDGHDLRVVRRFAYDDFANRLS